MTADSYDIVAADETGVLPVAAAPSERSSDGERGHLRPVWGGGR